jgi:hypothetical protein
MTPPYLVDSAKKPRKFAAQVQLRDIVRDAVATAFVDERTAHVPTARSTQYAERAPARVPHGKRIVDYTKDELTAAVERACADIGHGQFYTLLNGIDAYFERRKRQTFSA